MILVEVSVQTRFVEFVVTTRVTVPVNPFSGATVMVELPATPAFKITLFRLTVTVKS